MKNHHTKAINLLLAIACLIIAHPVHPYSQDPRSCTDPRTQYPSNPPCLKQ